MPVINLAQRRAARAECGYSGVSKERETVTEIYVPGRSVFTNGSQYWIADSMRHLSKLEGSSMRELRQDGWRALPPSKLLATIVNLDPSVREVHTCRVWCRMRKPGFFTAEL